MTTTANNLKRVAFLLLTFMMISFSSCSKDKSNSASGRIEYTIDGKTYVQTDDIAAAFVGGQFMGLSDGNLDAKVGDSQSISIVVGTTYNKFRWLFKFDGKTFSSTAGSTSLNKVTFTKNDSNLLEGTFEGQVKLDGEISNPAKVVTGKFTVRKFTRIG